MQFAWTCACCGKQFNSLPLNYGAAAPDYWFQIPEAERESRALLDSDFCTIDGEHHFIRGCIEIPVIGTDEVFVWGVWVSLSEASIQRVMELWDANVAEEEPPRFGWLSTNIRVYPSTLNLKTSVHLRSGGLRPRIEVEPTDHPLAREQRDGMTIERVQEIASRLLHRH